MFPATYLARRALDDLELPVSLFDQHFGLGLLNEDLVNLDVQQFKPEEIKVKTVDNYIVVEGKHEERKDEHGFISREFQRRYLLPEGVDPQAVTSTLSSDGILSIAAPKVVPAVGNERAVPITHTNAPAIKQQDQGDK
uniref:SHSP domain-containing protein n=1 Tax=Timema douglasi TaxID=61478 RepID=A0A7R8VM15_TIMDO|nr:unnamed protein product [Timema douglasi]